MSSRLTYRLLLEGRSYPAKLSNFQMRDWIVDNQLKNAGGLIEWSETGELLFGIPVFHLKEIPVSSFHSAAIKPRHKHPLPPIVVLVRPENRYVILDGTHRIAEATYRHDKMILCYVGETDEADFNGI